MYVKNKCQFPLPISFTNVLYEFSSGIWYMRADWIFNMIILAIDLFVTDMINFRLEFSKWQVNKGESKDNIMNKR